MNQYPTNVYLSVLVATIFLGLVIFFWGLGDIPLLSFNEARRAIPVSNMIADGDWLLPKLNGDLYITKPPLLYWVSASISTLFGVVNEWTVRLTSALAACATGWLVYSYTKRHFGHWSALFALQILIANAGFSMLGRQAGIEMLLSFLCFSSLICALKYTNENLNRKWLFLSYFLLGMAVLTKGPIALLFVTLPLFIDALYQRKPRQWLALKDPIGWLIFLIVGSSWYLAVSLQLGFDVWQTTLQKDMVTKIYGSTGEPFYNYILWLAADFFPAFFLIFIRPINVWRLWKHYEIAISLLVALIVPILIYSIISDKHAKYLLPIYPVFAILLGSRLDIFFKTARPILKKIILLSPMILLAGYALFYTVVEKKVFNYRYEALPHIESWIKENAKQFPMYGYKHLDERLIYYAHRNILVIDKAQLASLKTIDAILFVEDSDIPGVKAEAQCTIKEFKPYLRRKGALAILGFGAACQNHR